MPGILPMKVIKVGNNSQSRIAQACDRCRSKKIRCDGVRPCCSQCANVGFECKTSDKLSRRAFPRGYTESLEERVRALEAEVRELKELLDEKDEKIDMLSKMHSNRRASIENSTKASPPSWNMRNLSDIPVDTTANTPSSSVSKSVDKASATFVGRSNGTAFAEMLQRKIDNCAKSSGNLSLNTLFEGSKSVKSTAASSKTSSAPPRMFSDRAVNIFFQEWAPLFPVLHRPNFLKQYEDYVTKPEAVTDKHKLAQLHLVFSIAGLSSPLPDNEHVQSCDQQWQQTIEAVSADNTLVALQTLVLAIICCISKADYKMLLHHMSNAVALCYRLGLHKSHIHDKADPVHVEIKKKVFWTLYTLDCFSAVMLGVPKLLKEADIQCERPNDIDNECLLKKSPKDKAYSDDSKMSSALHLFDLARIIAKILAEVYPAAVMHILSAQRVSNLERQLNEWHDALGPQHKLTFAQDKPSTNLTGSRSAFLSLAYYYTRNLIHRPLLDSPLGHNESSASISIGESSKRIVQIVQLLDERNMSFSFCLNRTDLLILCGLGSIYQNLNFKSGSSMLKDGNRTIAVIKTYLLKADAPRAAIFEKLVNVSMTQEASIKSGDSPDGSMPVTSRPKLTTRPSGQQQKTAPLAVPNVKNLEALKAQQERLRKVKLSQSPSLDLAHLASATLNHDVISPSSTTSSISGLLHRAASSSQHTTPPELKRTTSKTTSVKNLDYLSFNDTPSHSRPASPVLTCTNLEQVSPVFSATSTMQPPAQFFKTSSVSPTEWQPLLVFDEPEQTNIYDTSSTAPALPIKPRHSSAHDLSSLTSPTIYQPEPTTTHSPYDNIWGPSVEQWNYDGLSLHEFTKQELSMNLSQSAFSFSEESLSSGDEQNGDLYGSSGSDMGTSESPPSLFKSEIGLDLMVSGANRHSFSFDVGEGFGL